MISKYKPSNNWDTPISGNLHMGTHVKPTNYHDILDSVPCQHLAGLNLQEAAVLHMSQIATVKDCRIRTWSQPASFSRIQHQFMTNDANDDYGGRWILHQCSKF